MMILSSVLVSMLLLSQTTHAAREIHMIVTHEDASAETNNPADFEKENADYKGSEEFSQPPLDEVFDSFYNGNLEQPKHHSTYEDPTQNDALQSPEPKDNQKRDEYYESLAKKAENSFPSLRPLKYKPDQSEDLQAGASDSDYYLPGPLPPLPDYNKPVTMDKDYYSKHRDNSEYDSVEFTTRPRFPLDEYDIDIPKNIEPFSKTSYNKPTNSDSYSKTSYNKPTSSDSYSKTSYNNPSHSKSYPKSTKGRSVDSAIYSKPSYRYPADYYSKPAYSGKPVDSSIYSKSSYRYSADPVDYSKLSYKKSIDSDTYSKPYYPYPADPVDYSSKLSYKNPIDSDTYSKPSYPYPADPVDYSKSTYRKPIDSSIYSKPTYRKPSYSEMYPKPISGLSKKYLTSARSAVPKAMELPLLSRSPKNSKLSSSPSLPKYKPKKNAYRSKTRKGHTVKTSVDTQARYPDYPESDFPAKPLSNPWTTEKRHIAPTLASEEGRLFLSSSNYGKPVREQFHEQGTTGPESYKFGYNTGDKDNPMARYEERDADGVVKGSYSFVDPLGELKVVRYESHPMFGFRTSAS